ncbi:MAG: dihydrofolate reductase [Bacteroidota bacterium]
MLSIIVAIGENGAIGKNNDLLWRLPGDLKRFKALTTGHTIIMGRKTFESLPNGALPNRTNVVLTRNKSTLFSDCTIVYSIKDIIDNYLNDENEHFVIGGGELYKALLPYANRIYLTRVHQNFEADTFFPAIDMKDWIIEEENSFPADEKNEYAYTYINLKKLE